MLTPFKADDDIFRFGPGDLARCYATITGIWTYSVFDNAYEFLPRVTPGGGTPATADGTLAPNASACN